MRVKDFFDKYVNHTDDCQKGITSETCTCGLMKNLPHIFTLALEAETHEKESLEEGAYQLKGYDS